MATASERDFCFVEHNQSRMLLSEVRWKNSNALRLPFALRNLSEAIGDPPIESVFARISALGSVSLELRRAN